MLESLPFELLGKIGSFLDKPKDIANARMSCKSLALALKPAYCKSLGNMPLYPSLWSFQDFFAMLEDIPIMRLYVHNIVLVSEGFKAPKYSYWWHWETLAGAEGLYVSPRDHAILDRIEDNHKMHKILNNRFIHSGAYQFLLSKSYISCELHPAHVLITTPRIKPTSSPHLQIFALSSSAHSLVASIFQVGQVLDYSVTSRSGMPVCPPITSTTEAGSTI